MNTGIGTPVPGPYTLRSVAAIVLGGVSLAGGRGGMLGPIVAAFILALIRNNLFFLGVDPNYSTVIQGVDPGHRGHDRRPGDHAAHSEARPSTEPAAIADGGWLARGAWRRRFREQPLIPLLLLLLALLVLLLFAVQPGLLGRPQAWLSSTIRFATPLAILAACQTLTMLTGGIDLSVATVASAAGFIMASQAPTQGPLVAILLALGVAARASGSSTASAWASSGSSR